MHVMYRNCAKSELDKWELEIYPKGEQEKCARKGEQETELRVFKCDRK